MGIDSQLNVPDEIAASDKKAESWLEEEQHDDFLICSLDNTLFAFRSIYIKKIRPYIHITYVPGCPEYVLGVIHIRGIIESVLDLRTILDLAKKEPDTKSKIVLFKTDNLGSGFLVDSVEDIVSIPQSTIKQPLSSLPDTVKLLISGVFQHQKRHAVILDMDKLSEKILELA